MNSFDGEDIPTVDEQSNDRTKVADAGHRLNNQLARSDYLPFGQLGRCSDCMHLMGYSTQYGTMYARCEEFRKALNPTDPVTTCTCYWRRTLLSLREMYDMATLLEVNNKRQAGFMSEELNAT